MPPDLALLSTLIGSNYPCLELIFMVPKVFESLKFDCNLFYRNNSLYCDTILTTTTLMLNKNCLVGSIISDSPVFDSHFLGPLSQKFAGLSRCDNEKKFTDEERRSVLE